ncbi:MAG: UDP-N-acetylglucosamine diphosphorylase/glucosamine-1-phosphate N-acetyltransferase [Myxococcales bacterium]|nr:UDP-N-acetylglucosamine diphosphorylase/glucosamine-1-phosphate N-acetyltransferase [Myxococcales bacterium]
MFTAVVLAAGLGTRMRSPLAKVLHPLLGRPMVSWIIAALREAGVAEIIVVVHHQEEAVRAAVLAEDPTVRFARQHEPKGTGDALRSAAQLLGPAGTVLVTAGDTPLLQASDIRRLLAAHRPGGGRSQRMATAASFIAQDPAGYGRIVPGVGIVEQAHCSPDQDAIREVNSGLYAFESTWLHAQLPTLLAHPPKGELYVTDLLGRLDGVDTGVADGFAASAFAGVNDRAQLADARGVLRRRINRAWAEHGVDFADLDHALIDVRAILHPGASIGFNAVIEGACDIAGSIGANAVVRHTTVAAGAAIHPATVCDGAAVRGGAQVGPMARLRPGAVIEEGAHVGNFVEVKNAVLRRGAKANHLSYIGDADIGEGANIGAGTITCNYDGFRKHKTVIGERSFIGSNTALVAPITIGAGAIVAAGSTLIQDVPADAIAIARGQQRNREGSATRFRARLAAEATSALKSSV